MKTINKFFDGAFGTYYLSQTGDEQNCELANIHHKEAVKNIHKEYIQAGVDYIKSNTFNANPTVYKSKEELREIIESGYEIATDAVAGTKVVVFADIGDIGTETADGESIAQQYETVADIFIQLGAKNFLFETLSQYTPVAPAVKHIKERVPDAQIIVSFAISEEGYSRKGIPYRELIQKALENTSIDIIGLNCVCGPAHLLKLVKSIGNIAKPLCVMPNSGYPSTVNGRMVFQNNSDYFAEKLLELHQIGVGILGGCCGTTPKHIACAIQKIKDQVQPTTPKETYITHNKGNSNRLPMKEIVVELDPPMDGNCDFLLEAVEKLKACGVNTITLADSPLSKARADSILTGAKIKTSKDIQVLPHITCRDKNHIALKGALLGAHFFGIERVLIITGDPVTYDTGNRKAGVYVFNSMELMDYIRNLNETIFVDRPFEIGGALNVNATKMEVEIQRGKKKIAVGAKFLLSQPIYTEKAEQNFIRSKKELDCKLYAGILPIASYRNAVFLNNEVTGIEIPTNVIEALKGKDMEETYDISIEYSKNIIQRVYDAADGFYIMTPLKKIDLVCQLIKECFHVC